MVLYLETRGSRLGKGSWSSLGEGSWPNLGRGSWPILSKSSWPSLDEGSWPNLCRGSWPNLGKGTWISLDGSWPNLGKGSWPSLGNGLILLVILCLPLRRRIGRSRRVIHFRLGKSDIHSNIQSTGMRVVATVPFLMEVVPHKNTTKSTRVKFRPLIFMKMNKCNTSKNPRWEY